MSGRLRMRQRNVFMVTIVFSLSINRSAINNSCNKLGARVRRPGKSADLSSCIFSLQLLRSFVCLDFTSVKKFYLVSPLFDFYWTVANLKKNYHISIELAFYRMTWVLYDIVCVGDCCAIWRIFSIVIFCIFIDFLTNYVVWMLSEHGEYFHLKRIIIRRRLEILI